MSLSVFLKRLDAYPKPLEDFRVKTVPGACITIAACLSMIALFVLEWNEFRRVSISQELFVDVSRDQKLTINLNATFGAIPCELISFDSMDVSGESHIEHNGLKKVNLDKQGNVIVGNSSESSTSTSTSTTSTMSDLSVNETALGQLKCLSCYGAEAANIKCCNSCDDVRRAYRQKNWHFSPYGVEQCKDQLNSNDFGSAGGLKNSDPEQIQRLFESGQGCRLEGHLEVNKVAGNFHIAPGVSMQQNHMHFHDIKNLQMSKFNTKHFFEQFSFGDEYPNQMNPLEARSYRFKKYDDDDDSAKSVAPQAQNLIDFGFFQMFNNIDNTNSESDDVNNAISYSYFIKIVPTTYEYLDGRIVNNTYQYSVTKSSKAITGSSLMGSGSLPGVFVNYELGAIMVKFIEKSKPFSTFLTSCCAIIGGFFTLAGMLDAFTYRYYNMYKKFQMNKLT
jgi:hypothetical protein